MMEQVFLSRVFLVFPGLFVLMAAGCSYSCACLSGALVPAAETCSCSRFAGNLVSGFLSCVGRFSLGSAGSRSADGECRRESQATLGALGRFNSPPWGLEPLTGHWEDGTPGGRCRGCSPPATLSAEE